MYEKGKMCEVVNAETCSKCMFDAPHPYCCKHECGEHEDCNKCKAKCKELV